MNEKLKEELQKLAARKTHYEVAGEEMPDCGGNSDDAYFFGYDDGKTEFARELLNEFFTE